MGLLQRFEGGVEDAFDKAGARVFKGAIEPAQVARRAEKQMKREKMVGAGKQHAPTLYTVLVSPKDDSRLFNFYPTMAAEIETYLLSRGADANLSFDGRPLVRFIVDKKLKSSRFDVIAEHVAAPIIAKLREEEAAYLGLAPPEPAPQPIDLDPIEEDDQPSAYQDYVDENSLRAALRQIHASDADDDGPQEVGLSPYASAGQDALAAPASDPLSSDMAPAELVVANHASLVDHATGTEYRLDLTKMVVGRSQDCDIVLNDGNASRQHAMLRQNALGKWRVVDLNSTNGTLVNGRAAERMILRDGDELTIGVTILEFVCEQDS